MSVFIISVVLSLSSALLGFLAFFDFSQLVLKLPRKSVYAVYHYRIPLIIIGLVSFAAATFSGFLVLGISAGWMLAYMGLFMLLFANGYIFAPYVIFPSKHQDAKYKLISEMQNEIADDEIVLVVAVDGEAAAFPQHWVERPHVAGLNLGGEDLIMTFCGLSNLGVVFRDKLHGRSMNLRVLAQVEHNVLLFDTKSQALVEQVYGEIVDSGEELESLPAVFMTFGSYKALYSNGKVFFNPPKNNLTEKMTRMMLDKLLYASGGHYDPSTPRLAFPTVEYSDQRIGAKEKIYGVSLNGRHVAYTLDYMKANGNVVTENFGGKDITIKYFEEYDFVDVFAGDVPHVDAQGRDEDGNFIPRVMHANGMLWIIWANFYTGTEVRVQMESLKLKSVA